MWIKNGVVYRTHAAMRQAMPNVSLPAAITDDVVAAFGFEPVVATERPTFDDSTETVEEAPPVNDGGVWRQDWTVRTLTAEEQSARQAVMDRERERTARDFASERVLREQMAAKLDDLPDEELDTVTYLYEEWSGDGVAVALNDLRRRNGKLWKVIQPHTTQPDWPPEAAPALWARVRESGTEWFAGEPVAAGMVRTYQGTSYTALQGHTTQAGWEPPNAPALWEGS